MGIYINHGIEYRILYRDGTHTIIVSSKELDKRLLDSVYYSRRAHVWFNNIKEYAIPIENIDIELTDNEKLKLQENLNTTSSVIHHGWYDVNSIQTTW